VKKATGKSQIKTMGDELKGLVILLAISAGLSLLYCLRYAAWWEGRFLVSIRRWLKGEGFKSGVMIWLLVTLLLAFFIWLCFVGSGLWGYLKNPL